MREIAVSSSNGSASSSDRATYETEFVALRQEIDRITKNTTFNGQTCYLFR